MITVVSSCYGDYDDLRDPPPMDGVDWVMVTDRHHPELSDGGWLQRVEPRPHLHPRMAAKYAKLFPWEYAPQGNVIMWADASVQFTGRHLQGLADLIGPVSKAFMWTHPWRDDFTAEAWASHEMPKYQDQNVLNQVAYYATQAMPADWGLWATGFAVYPNWSARIDTINRAWMAEMVRWTYQDQLSLPYVTWRLGGRPEPIPVGWHLDNPWLTFLNHRSEL